ncbi:hypothetical protein IMSHALPRED_000371 [Imshaugia aleurites]|uniref:Uncharacterized protein n=1 Tax=Imshaugia aleurites TaxID=172621 RepID=A0A8H3ESG7_9LECA|nr:hypothetical protein IMSHALPRED_000371 [Imshaugia aleurites]
MPPPRIHPLRFRPPCKPFRYTTCPPSRRSSTSTAPPNAPLPAALPARWLSDIKQRLGKCIIFGLSQEQIDEAGSILRTVARDWRELLAGSEGFLTGRGRAGCEGREVVWGEMPMAWPDRISVYHKLRAAPTASTDSFILDVLILSERHQRPAARCVEDIVVYDYRRGVKSPLRDFVVDQFRKTFELQEQSKTRNELRVKDLLQRVQRLEKQVWDRPDAVEDMGDG